MKVTIESICQETEYKPAPGTEYEVADGVVVTMRRPYESVVDEYVRLDDEAQSIGGKTERNAHKLKMLGVVADGWDGSAHDVIFKVVDRVLTDFFIVCTPSMSEPMRSLVVAMAALDQSEVNDQQAQTAES